jgi:N,N-dimethylformamidase beta subunit-like, C-terminal/Concanavalin A-like lectin/glucanases superfamily
VANERGRPHQVNGAWVYVEPVGVAPGAEVRVHASLDAASSIEFVRLGERAILESGGADRDREDFDTLASFDVATASPQVTTPGSYVLAGGPPIVGPELTLSVWLRVWMCPQRETNQWYAAGIITDLDYPDACRFGLLLDSRGRICSYAGDGWAFDHARLGVAADIRGSLGTWIHVAAAFGMEGTSVWIDGELRYADDRGAGQGLATAGPKARLRIGALAEDGLADGHLDADISQPAIFDGALTTEDIAAIVRSRGRHRPSELVRTSLLAEWLLSEESGTRVADASDNARDGVIVNAGTWEVGGPAANSTVDDPDYDPRTDPDRGHALRLCSDDLIDCDWPVLAALTVPLDAESGFYAARVRLQGSERVLTVPYVVVRTQPSHKHSAVLVVPTNTWHAYGRRFDDIAVPAGLHSSFYTAHTNSRPFFELGFQLPIPRANPYQGDSARADRQGHVQLVRPERIAAAWLRREGYPLAVATDLELHRGDIALDDFACVILAGHSEYWSNEMRLQVESYLERGGRLLSLSGDTASQRVVIDEGRATISARKIHEDDALWLTPQWRGERWHPGGEGRGGRFRSLDRPPAAMLGVSTKGMIDDGTPSSFAALTVLAPDHPLFHDPEPVPIARDGTIGSISVNGPAASGYEFDASPDVMGFLPAPLPGLTVLARAIGQRNLGWIGHEVHSGADAVYWERPAGGLVFTVSSIGASGALADPGVAALVRNVLHRFGVQRMAPR